jgi:mRNA-degrading endonuclease RelE of RelBE toxin-antitoxin system
VIGTPASTRYLKETCGWVDAVLLEAIITLMARKHPFSLDYEPDVREHLRAIDSKYHSLIHDAIEEQLLFEPDTETRNRKALDPPAPFEATWEIRFGPGNRFRVFYIVDQDSRAVQIVAIGVKKGNRLIVGGMEIEL